MLTTPRRRSNQHKDERYQRSSSSQKIDITEGNLDNDPRVIQFLREIRQLKEKVELQTELNRKLEESNNKLQSELDSYKQKCNDLQRNLDDKDQHLNEVVASLTQSHQKPSRTSSGKKRKNSWFGGFGSSRNVNPAISPSSSLHRGHSVKPHANMLYTPQTISRDHSAPGVCVIDSPSVDFHDDYIGDSPLRNVSPTYSPPHAPLRKGTSEHILGANDTADDGNWSVSSRAFGTSSLAGMDRDEMMFKIKNTSSKDKLRGSLNKEKSQLFQDFVKATHNQGWTQKQAQNLEKDAKRAKEREKAAKTHIVSLEKSLSKERERVQKCKSSFERFKASAIQKRKECLVNDRKLKLQLTLKDAFIEKACAKLVLFKDRLAQFEVAVFQEFVVLVAPHIEDLIQFDSDRVNAPCANASTLSTLYEVTVHDDVQSAGGTITSIASNCSTGSAASTGRQKSVSRKSSIASISQPAMEAVNEYRDASDDCASMTIQPIESKRASKRDRRKRDKRRSPRYKTTDDVAKKKKKRTKAMRKGSFKKKQEKKDKKRKMLKREKPSTERKEEEEDSLDLSFEDLVPSSASSIGSDPEWRDSTDSEDGGQSQIRGRLDENGRYIEHRIDIGGSNNLRHYVELKVVKYPGTGELFMIITRFDEERSAVEVFRTDFAHCVQIEKCEGEEDFAICFEGVMIVLRADDYEKARSMLINLRLLFDQHSANIQPELPPPPAQIVTDQMNLFFGGF